MKKLLISYEHGFISLNSQNVPNILELCSNFLVLRHTFPSKPEEYQILKNVKIFGKNIQNLHFMTLFRQKFLIFPILGDLKISIFEFPLAFPAKYLRPIHNCAVIPLKVKILEFFKI